MKARWAILLLAISFLCLVLSGTLWESKYSWTIETIPKILVWVSAIFGTSSLYLLFRVFIGERSMVNNTKSFIKEMFSMDKTLKTILWVGIMAGILIMIWQLSKAQYQWGKIGDRYGVYIIDTRNGHLWLRYNSGKFIDCGTVNKPVYEEQETQKKVIREDYLGQTPKYKPPKTGIFKDLLK